jgi:hypothetical protein
MEPDSYTEKDLRELDNEIKFLTPKYQKFVVALISGYVERLRRELVTPDFKIVVEKAGDSPLPTLERIFETAFTPGARTGAVRNDFGKVGDHFEIDLDQYEP